MALGPRFRGDERRELFSRASVWNLLTYIITTLLTTKSIYAREVKSPLVEGVSGNDPKAERGCGESRHGGAPRGERVRHASHGARRVLHTRRARCAAKQK